MQAFPGGIVVSLPGREALCRGWPGCVTPPGRWLSLVRLLPYRIITDIGLGGGKDLELRSRRAANVWEGDRGRDEGKETVGEAGVHEIS